MDKHCADRADGRDFWARAIVHACLALATRSGNVGNQLSTPTFTTARPPREGLNQQKMGRFVSAHLHAHIPHRDTRPSAKLRRLSVQPEAGTAALDVCDVT